MKPESTEELIALLVEGELHTEQVAELKQRLRKDPQLATEVRRQIALHGQLSIACEDELASERMQRQIISKVADAEAEDFTSQVTARLSRRRSTRRLLALAAVMALCATAIFFWNLPSLSTEQTTIATLMHSDGVHWHGERLTDGAVVQAGDSVQFDSGLLELELAGRGTLVVEGPAHVDFPAADRAVLHRGSLVMRATEKGHGYRVETSQGSVVDLGTEFAVSVSDDDVVETHVIDGSVEAIPSKGESVTLEKNKAFRLHPEGGEAIDADVGKFYTRMPPRHDVAAQFIHWNFDDSKGLLARAQGELGRSNGQPNDLVFFADPPGTTPQWIDGARGAALHFDGRGAYAESNYRGIEGGSPRTVSFWVRVPEDFILTQGFGMVSWGRKAYRGEAWQISVNPLVKDGPVGRLRLGLHGGQIIGTTDLRDGKWHHIAVVMYGGSQPNVGTHVLLYVDGRKETVSRAALQEVKTQVEKAKHGLWVGRNVTYTLDSKTMNTQGGFFRGALDELYVFDAALSQSEILELMERGK
ncbi:hypothetical protein JIN77_15430 [Verrucomicrobiaceae bacterium R5-34]|nr:hypothetical protein [Verrucomicrobiaceae bacterium R5-34]